MFENVGGKIKVIAKVFFWIMFIASAITGLVFLSNQYTWWIGLIILVGGFFASWISALFLCGFGELVENSAIIVKNTTNNTNCSSRAAANTYPNTASAANTQSLNDENIAQMLKAWKDDGLISEEEYQEKMKIL